MKSMRWPTSIGLALIGMSLYANEPAESPKPRLNEVYVRKFGGQVEQPGSRQGSIAFIKCQPSVDTSILHKVAEELKKMLKIEVNVTEGRIRQGLPTQSDVQSAGATAAVFVIADQTIPALLSAPEERWALVNVAKMTNRIPVGIVGQSMLRTRLQSEVWRAFALVCGGQSSQSPVSVFNAPTMESLDTIDAKAVSYDVIQRTGNYLRNVLKVTPARTVTYQRAAQEGWAPAPTNDVQRAIWEKVYAIPSKPMKIEFDPKRGR